MIEQIELRSSMLPSMGVSSLPLSFLLDGTRARGCSLERHPRSQAVGNLMQRPCQFGLDLLGAHLMGDVRPELAPDRQRSATDHVVRLVAQILGVDVAASDRARHGKSVGECQLDFLHLLAGKTNEVSRAAGVPWPQQSNAGSPVDWHPDRDRARAIEWNLQFLVQRERT